MKRLTTLTIPADGKTVTGLHTDAIDLRSLGPQTVKRASDVEFNEATQQWEVLLPKHLTPHKFVLHADGSRQACLDWEREFFTK